MGKYERGEREEVVGAISESAVHSIGPADDEYDIFAGGQYTLDMTRKGRGVEELAALVEYNHVIARCEARKYAL